MQRNHTQNENKRICFFDVDGTLTNEHGGAEIAIPESTKIALQKAHDAGVLLFVNTGRPFSTVPQKIKDLPMDGFVCGCGTWICHEGKELFRNEIEKKERIAIMNKVKGLGLSCVYESKEGFAVFDPLHHEPMKRITDTYLQDGFQLLDVNDDLVFEKFCFFKDPAQPWPDLSFLDEYDKIFKFDYFCEIVPLTCSKGKAIHFLKERLNIKEENCYSFGDSENDVEMLKATYHSIVMGNASDEVKTLGTYLAKKASEDGLYEAMEHFGLFEEKKYDEK